MITYKCPGRILAYRDCHCQYMIEAHGCHDGNMMSKSHRCCAPRPILVVQKAESKIWCLGNDDSGGREGMGGGR